MGMDVYGNNPSHKDGEYFRANVWTWHPLANFIANTCPELAKNCPHWHSNDGAGLRASDALALADQLDHLIDCGAVDRYADEYDQAMRALPDETCSLCGGTGVRDDQVGRKMGMHTRVIGHEWRHTNEHPRYGKTGWCNGCDGIGKHRPFAENYRFIPELVQEFARFCRHSGGFRIC